MVARETPALIDQEFLLNLFFDFQKFLSPLKLHGSQEASFLALLRSMPTGCA